MSAYAEKKMGQSAACVLRHSKEIADILGVKRIIQCEEINDEVRIVLDTKCGLDWMIEGDEEIYYGVGVRVQWDRPYWRKYRSFTIRTESPSGLPVELAKRKKAIKKCGIYPSMTMQMYIDVDDNIDRLAVCWTRQIIDFIEEEHPKAVFNGEDGKMFVPIYWDKYKRSGRAIKIYDRADQQETIFRSAI